MTENNKWVACWGNATSITNRREAVYAKDLTLRYPIRMPFGGSMLRFRFSNLTGTEPVTLTKVFVGHTPITFGGEKKVCLMPGKETESDAISYPVHRGDTIEVSFYLVDYTQMNSGTLVTGPLSKGFYAYGDYAEADELPIDLSRHTNWFYFLNTVDVLTSPENRTPSRLSRGPTIWRSWHSVPMWQSSDGLSAAHVSYGNMTVLPIRPMV